jgi:hypothetical protein
VDLKTGERLLPWEPIPRESNVYMAVTVLRVEEFANVEFTPVAITLVAPRHDAADGAWRLLFQHVCAYRKLPIGAQACSHLIALREAREQRSLPEPATYEVVRSRWLREVVNPASHSRPQAVRHFVIASYDVAYDIAAEWCDAQEIGDAKQVWTDMQVVDLSAD